MIARLGGDDRRSRRLTPTKRGELRGKISTKPGLNRYLRTTPAGLLRLDRGEMQRRGQPGRQVPAALLAIRTCPAEDIALGYKQLLEVERGWRDMKQILDLRPVYHRLEERIRAHVLLCWLALLLARIVETTHHHHLDPRPQRAASASTWAPSPAPPAAFPQTTPPSPEAHRLHEALGLALPRILHLDTDPGT